MQGLLTKKNAYFEKRTHQQLKVLANTAKYSFGLNKFLLARKDGGDKAAVTSDLLVHHKISGASWISL
jgi:hypothetical protein